MFVSFGFLAYFLQVLGAITMGAGIWMVHKMTAFLDFITYLKPHYESAKSMTEPFYLQKYSYIFIYLGAAMFIASFLGYIAAFSESKTSVIIYSVIVVIIVVAQIISACVMQGQSENKPSALPDLMSKSAQAYRIDFAEPDVHATWDKLNKFYGCCGHENHSDFKVKWDEGEQVTPSMSKEDPEWNNESWIPDSCCKRGYDCKDNHNDDTSNYKRGCTSIMEKMLKNHRNLILFLGIGVSLLEAIMLITACCLFCKGRKGPCNPDGTMRSNCKLLVCEPSCPKPCPVLRPRTTCGVPEQEISVCNRIRSAGNMGDRKPGTLIVHGTQTAKECEQTQTVKCKSGCVVMCEEGCEPVLKPICEPVCETLCKTVCKPVCESPCDTVCKPKCPKRTSSVCFAPRKPDLQCLGSEEFCLPVIKPADDRCCLERQLHSKEFQLMYQRERMLLEQKLHHREQLLWDHEQFREQQLMLRERQFRFKSQKLTHDQEFHNRDQQLRGDREQMIMEQETAMQDALLARARQRFIIQKDALSTQDDEASKRIMKLYAKCFNKSLSCINFTNSGEGHCEGEFDMDCGSSSPKRCFESCVQRCEIPNNICKIMKCEPACKVECKDAVCDAAPRRNARCSSHERPKTRNNSRCTETCEYKKICIPKCVPKAELVCKTKKPHIKCQCHECTIKPCVTNACDRKGKRIVGNKFIKRLRGGDIDELHYVNNGKASNSHYSRSRSNAMYAPPIDLSDSNSCTQTHRSSRRDAPVIVQPITITSNPLLCDCECHFDSARSDNFCDFCDCDSFRMESGVSWGVPRAHSSSIPSASIEPRIRAAMPGGGSGLQSENQKHGGKVKNFSKTLDKSNKRNNSAPKPRVMSSKDQNVKARDKSRGRDCYYVVRNVRDEFEPKPQGRLAAGSSRRKSAACDRNEGRQLPPKTYFIRSHSFVCLEDCIRDKRNY